MSRFFATASRGTEEILADELRALGIAPVTAGRGGVAFGDSPEDGYRACLWSRVASRVLLPLAEFEVDGADALYEKARAIPWADHLGAERTLAVDAAGGRSPAGPRHFVALKTKDAIVDRLRADEGARPSIDTKTPDLRVNVHLRGPHVSVSLDLSGVMHRRGIGREGSGAPLKENLAAAILLMAGWPGEEGTPLLDPFCGSGTLLLEAAWVALDVAPGLFRKRIGAEGWRGHDAELWKRLRDEAHARREDAASRELRIAGADASSAAVKTARENLAKAGLGSRVRVDRRELRDASPPWERPGLVVTNPPYGERVGEAGELGPVYELLGDVLRRRFPGWSAWVLSGNPALAKRIGLKPASRHVLYNGPIEARLIEIPIADTPVAGKTGPGWRRPGKLARAFAKRLKANLDERRAWAATAGLTCFRVYDAEMPEYNLAVDWYDGAARVEEYARPRKVPAEIADRHLREALAVVPDVLGIEAADMVLRVRSRRGAGEQHHRRGDLGRLREVREGDLRFLVNLEDYLDTGLFLDDRELRRTIRERARGRDVLNLFAYTGTASVAAAAGGARSTTSVDLSNTYLTWARRNFAANGMDLAAHRLVRADAVSWLSGARERYDMILLAPPTHSRSKAMRGDFDVQRDHTRLIASAARRLRPRGEVLFTTNLRTFEMDERELRGLTIRELTAEITPPDFAHRPRLRAWSVRGRASR